MSRKAYPSDLTDEEWRLIEPLLPALKPICHPRIVDYREIVNAIAYLLHYGCTQNFTPLLDCKAYFGIANGYSTITPCNMGLNGLAQRAEARIRNAGVMPQVFGTITISDVISMGTEGMKYSLVSSRA